MAYLVSSYTLIDNLLATPYSDYSIKTPALAIFTHTIPIMPTAPIPTLTTHSPIHIIHALTILAQAKNTQIILFPLLLSNLLLIANYNFWQQKNLKKRLLNLGPS